jgi:hypothetical protein
LPGVTASRRKFETLWLNPDQQKPDHICRKTAQATCPDRSQSSGRTAIPIEVATSTRLLPKRSEARPQRGSAGIWTRITAETATMYST